MTSPPTYAPAAVVRTLSPLLLLAGTALALLVLVIQPSADAASSGTLGIGVKRWGSTYSTGSGYERYAYVNVAPGDAAAAGSLPTTSLVYMSGTSVQTSWSTGVSYQEALANNWLLKDASGQYLMNVAYGAYVGDFGSTAYQQRFVDNVAALLSRNGNEGVFVDDVIGSPEGLTGGKYPAKYPTQKAWEDAQVAFVQNVSQELRARGYYVLIQAIKFISGDPGSNDGSTNAAFWRRLAPYVSGIQSEYWMQDPNTVTRLRASGSAWYEQWDAWGELMNIAQSAGSDFFAMMYGSASDVEIMRYGKGSFLLFWDGSGGAFTYDHSGDPWNVEWTKDIGQPAGPRYQVGVGWRRDYTGGTVILNPSPSASQTFSLGGTYTRPDGTSVTSVTLGPTRALVLAGGSGGSTPPPSEPPPSEPTPPPPSTTPSSSFLSDLSWTSASNGWGPVEKDRSNAEAAAGDGRTITLNGTTYAKGLGTHAAADVRYNLGGSCSRFKASVGVDDEVGTNGSVAFQVYADAGKAFDSGVMTGASATKDIDVSVAGASELRLVVGNGGDNINYDHADWASARIECGSTTPPPSEPTPPPPSTTPAAPVNSTLPAISGTAQAGASLSASTGTWSNSPTGYAYQWRRCDSSGVSCASISGATANAYPPVPADVGGTLRVVVTATNAGGSASATSNASAVVAPAPAPPPSDPPPVNTSPPSVTGTPEETRVLSASSGTWIYGTSHSYQWRRCDTSGGSCASIAGATASQYTLGSADVGRTLRVLVTAANSSGQSSATSAATSVVAPRPIPPPPPVNVAAPTISGQTWVGKRLRASDGAWTNSPTRFTYQWRRCSPSLASCETITGATDSTYVLDPGDVGYRFVVVVTAWNAGGSSSAASAPSADVRWRPGVGPS